MKIYRLNYYRILIRRNFNEKNAAQREYKKLSGQINQIENIVRHSKAGALFEHESTLRKKYCN